MCLLNEVTIFCIWRNLVRQSNIDSSSDTEEILNSDSDEENKLLHLTKMGFLEAEASITIERCGSYSSITELTDFICVDQMAKATDALLMRKLEKKLLNEDDHAVHLSISMIGYGIPIEPDQITQRTLPEDAIGSSYFYYEQIHLSNLMIGFGVHTKPDQITQRTLIEDAIGSSYFYYEQIHLLNLMIGFEVHTKPDQITQRTLPEDAIGAPYFYYEQIHLSNPMIGFGIPIEPDQITQRTLPEDAIGAPYFYYENVALAPNKVELFINMYRKCQIDRKDLNKVTPFEPDEVEMLLGFPKNYTRGEGSARDMFPSDINVLSLSGISDAKVAFYCLGISFNLLKDIMGIILTKKVIGIEEVAMMYQDLSQHHGIIRVQFNSPDFMASWTICFQESEMLHHSGFVHSSSTTEVWVDSGKVGSFKLVQYVASGFH
ncbi:hypothetical protein F3Y22_tig00111317pilonHSYRG00007 [Hibiscus syriacus]|uniref:DNA (Cytosine-5)-methyltransferase DRM1/2 n=1 Tax=Hibiscus syriacus TaxID=106335 RepID=A0A6A2YQE4_HIBSY|nr:hypothetical protein F3Y22_tig00111317pilonHSYRG00007 [Hibiscus syriacus]